MNIKEGEKKKRKPWLMVVATLSQVRINNDRLQMKAGYRPRWSVKFLDLSAQRVSKAQDT